MEQDRKILHLSETAVKFRPKPAKKSRGAFSPRRDSEAAIANRYLYRYEVYGDRNKMSCYFIPSGKTENRSNFRRSHVPRQNTEFQNNDTEKISVKPFYRVQSAPRKLAYLSRTGSRRSTREVTSSRPQTVAPRVREFPDTIISDGAKQGSGDYPSDIADGYSDQQTLDNTEPVQHYNRNTSLDYLWATSFDDTDYEENSDNVSWNNYNNDTECYSTINDERFKENMDQTKTKLHVTFAESFLSETKYVLRQPLTSNTRTRGSEQRDHEELLEKLRQSYGINLDDEKAEQNNEKDEEVLNKKTESAEKEDNESQTNDSTTTKEPEQDETKTKNHRDVPLKFIRSFVRKVPLKKVQMKQNYLVKHLREQRTKYSNRRKLSPLADIQQEIMAMESKPPKRDVRGLFLRSATFIWYVCRLLGCMIDLSADMTTRSATEEQWHALHTSKEARDMAFNKAAFAKRKDVNRVPKWAKQIMRKSPDDRTEQEVKRVHALLRGMQSFDRFTEKIQLSMCKSFVYYSINSGRVILRQGHVGQNFYFLFNGSVFVNLDDVDVKGNKFSKTEAILGRGDSFGELALLQDIRRTATITCREDCEMLVVDKDTFARICPRIFEMELEEKMRFVSKMKLFNMKIWDAESVRKMCFEAQIQEYKTNKVVVVDSEKDEWIYICMEGKCQVIRRLDLSEEIEWRKINQRYRNSSAERRMSRPDYLTVLTGLSNPVYGAKEVLGRRRSVNPAVKQNLLDSMGLEFLQKRRLSYDEWNMLMDLKLQQRRVRRESKGDLSTSLGSKGEYGPLTLTSLLANDEKQNGNHLYLIIHTMKQFDVFDLSSVLKGHEETDQSTGSHILVSLGSRLMRIKRSSYFKYATPDAIDLATGLALKYMYPSDDILLQRYRDFLHWEVYKYQVLQLALDHKNKSSEGDILPQRESGSRNNKPDKGKALFELNKSTLLELDSILQSDDESNKEENLKRLREVNSSTGKGWPCLPNKRVSKLPTLNRVQPRRKITQHQTKGNVMAEIPLAQRRVSKVTIATEFNTIQEIDD